MLELNCLYDLARLEAFDADADPLWDAFYERADGLQVRKESTRVYACYLQADAAFLFGKAPAFYGSAGDRMFTANLAYF